MSYLNEAPEALWRDALAALEGQGFAFNPLTTELPVYLSTCLGQANAYKTKTIPEMLAELDTSYGGLLSVLTSPVGELLDDLALNAGSGGGEDLPVGALTLNGKGLTINGKFLTLGM